MKHFNKLILIIFLPLTVNGQFLKGSIKDYSSYEPIESVFLALVDTNTYMIKNGLSTKYLGSTNSQGEFFIHIKSKDTFNLVISTPRGDFTWYYDITIKKIHNLDTILDIGTIYLFKQEEKVIIHKHKKDEIYYEHRYFGEGENIKSIYIKNLEIKYEVPCPFRENPLNYFFRYGDTYTIIYDEMKKCD